MKSIKYLFMSLLAAGTFVACTNSDEYVNTPKESGAGVYISSDVKTSVQAPDGMTEFTFPVNRMSSEGELTVALKVEQSDDNFFTLPSSVTFADGENEVEVTVEFTAEDLEYDVANSLRIEIDDPENTSLYAKSTITFTIVRPGPWLSLGKVDYTEDIVCSLYNAKPITYKVELQAALLEKDWGTFRLVNPYGESFPYNDPGDWDDSSDHYLQFRIEGLDLDPNSETYLEDIITEHSNIVWLEDQLLYLNWGDGEMGISSNIRYNLDLGVDIETIYNARPEWFGMFDKGVITLPKPMGSTFIELDGEAYNYINSNGAFKIVFPGVKLGNFSVTAELAGFFTDIEEQNFAVVNVTLGKNVVKARAGIALTSDADALYDAIVAGEIETVEFTASGAVNLPVEDGTSTIVVVTYDDEDSPREYDYITFKHFNGVVPEVNPLEGEWTIDDMYGISKAELFKSWYMWGVDWFDEDGNTDRIPLTVVKFSESNNDFEDEYGTIDAINIEGFSLGYVTDGSDSHLWEYYNGFLYNLYTHNNLGMYYGSYYVNYMPFASSGTLYGAYDEMMVCGLVDDGYMAMVYGELYNLGSNPAPEGFLWRAYNDAKCQTAAGNLEAIYNIMFEDPSVSSLSKSGVKAHKPVTTVKELNTMASQMATPLNYVELRGRERAHALIDELNAKRAEKQDCILEWKNAPSKVSKELKRAAAVQPDVTL